jgi:RND superfamily putative drug exporter
MIGAWILVIVTVIGLSSIFDPGEPSFTGDAGLTVTTEWEQGQDLIDAHFGKDNRASEVIVLTSESATVDDQVFKDTVNQVMTNLGSWQADFASIANYYDLAASGAPEADALVSETRHSMIIPITLNGTSDDYSDRGADYLHQVESASNDTVKTYAVGSVSGDETFNTILEEDLSKDMSVGMPAAGVVLLVVFGALIAAMLPLLLAFVTIGIASAFLLLLGNFMNVDSNANTLVIMIGLAVGVDYALFFLERFREERRHGAVKLDAIERAGATAGKAVIFSGLTVILAMMGLFFLPMDMFHSMAIGCASAVVIAVAASVTLLPAMLRLLGDWTNFPRFGMMRKLKRQDQTGVAQFREEQRGQGLWGRLANNVMRKPGLAFLISVAVLVLFAAPVLTMDLGTQTADTLPESRFRDGSLILADEFSAGVNDPLEIVIQGDAQSEQVKSFVQAFVAELRNEGAFGPASVSISPDNQLTVVEVATLADPNSEETVETIRHLRNTVVPDVFGDQAENVYVAGAPASNVDFDQALIDRLPIVFGFVLGLSFLLLLVAFRSVVVPLTAILLNLLSVGAAYGLTVAVFQHGWGADLIGVTHTPVITSWIPVFLFCILFGLSMDYHVFLLSRIREHWDLSKNNEESIVVGLQSTGRIITGAALIMVSVFASFTLGRVAELQQFGFGLGVAVLIDATLIRTILVPAMMKLLGRANWYMPRGLGWLPNFQIEGDLAPIHLERHAPQHDAPARGRSMPQPSMSAGGE